MQACMTNKKEKLSIDEGLYRNNCLKKRMALALQLEVRYVLRVRFALGGLRFE